MSEDIPSLTLRVLERIQDVLVEMKTDVRELKGEVHELKGEVHTLNGRFDNFLTLVGRDVQDLKVRVAALEAKRKPRS